MLSLIPANPQPFTLGPRDYLDQFLKLLSVLRNGDSRFLPLLLSKVHEVLPTLANPMLQTVPDTPATINCPEIDIFEGYAPMHMGPSVSANNYSMPATSAPEFKYSNGVEFKMENPGLPFDRRIEELNSPTHGPESSNSSSFSSAPIIPSSSSPMEFPSLSHDHYSFSDLNGQIMNSNIGNYGEGVGGGGSQPTFKREFDQGGMSMLPSASRNMAGPRPPLRQASSSSFGMQQMPRSVPEFHHLQRANSNGEHGDMGGGEMPFR